MTARPSLVQLAILGYIADHGGCGKAEVARATSYGQGASTERERMRTIQLLLDRRWVKSSAREAKRNLRPFALYLTPKGAALLADDTARMVLCRGSHQAPAPRSRRTPMGGPPVGRCSSCRERVVLNPNGTVADHAATDRLAEVDA